MRADFVIESTTIGLDRVEHALGRPPDKSIAIGDAIARSNRKYDRNIFRYRLSNGMRSDEVIDQIKDLIFGDNVKWSEIKESHKYLDITIESGSIIGDFCMSVEIVERMRVIDVQIQFDIPRY